MPTVNWTFSLPDDSERAYIGALRIRDFKRDVRERINEASPVGIIEEWFTESVPDGWAKCNGQSLVVANYPDLFAVIGYSYGGSGANFNVPDIRGRFVRCWDHGRGIDKDLLQNTITGDVTNGSNSITNVGNGVVSFPIFRTKTTNVVFDHSRYRISSSDHYITGVYSTPHASTILSNLSKKQYGAFGFEVAADGVVDAMSAATCVNFDTAELAHAAYEALSATAGHVKLGCVIVEIAAGTENFTGGTTGFNASHVVATVRPREPYFQPRIGSTITGTGIPGGTTITAISPTYGVPTTITISNNATASNNGVTLTIDGDHVGTIQHDENKTHTHKHIGGFNSDNGVGTGRHFYTSANQGGSEFRGKNVNSMFIIRTDTL